MTRRVLLAGATGFFAGLLARHLAKLPGIELVLSSRREERARALATAMAPGAAAQIGWCAFDRNAAGLPQRLHTLKPWLVIDATGPFQHCDYAFARAAISQGAHWIDLADARNYLLGFSAALESLAVARGVTAIAGASSTPALSSAVVESLTRGWRRVDTVDLAILPGGAGKVGRAVIEAILSYAGTPVAQRRNGKTVEIRGWNWPVRAQIPDLGMRFLSAVETADDVLLAERFGVRDRVAFSAGLESRLEHFGLALLAAARERGLCGGLNPLAPMLERARRITGLWASDRGAMIVDVAGIDEAGEIAQSHWRLIAERGEGPHVPILAALALTRRLMMGDAAAGARTACCALPLSLIEDEMRPLAIRTFQASRRHPACS